MGNWREVATTVAQRQRYTATPTPLIGDLSGLPADVAEALSTLEHLPAPLHLTQPDHWPMIIRDALSLSRDGWAAKAMALGWSAGDLFGIGPRDDWDFAGLAVWLRGRTIALLDRDCAIVTSSNQRSAFIRGGMGHGTHPTVTPVMLWEFGR